MRVSAISDQPELTSQTEAALRTRLALFMVGRAVVATLLVGLIPMIYGFQSEIRLWWTTVLAVLILGSLLVFAWVYRTYGNTRNLIIIQIAVDLLFITALLPPTDGVASGFSFLYGIEILMAATLAGPQVTVISGIASIILFASLGLIEPSQWAEIFAVHAPGPNETMSALVRTILGLGLVTYLCTGLAVRIRQTGAQLQAQADKTHFLEQLNERIIRALPSGIITADRGKKIVTINPAGQKILSCSDIGVGSAVEQVLQVRTKKTGADQVQRGEANAIGPGGNNIEVGYAKTSLLDHTGQEVGELWVFQDLTERNELRHRARAAERLAALGTVAAALAHEIRNPLGAMLGSVELVAQSQHISEEDSNLLQLVQKEILRLDHLVTNMLEMVRPKALNLQVCDLRTIIEELVTLARRDSHSRDIPIAFEGTHNPVPALVDAARIKQALWNLLRNAMQASSPDAPIQIDLSSMEDHIEIAIKDAGRGISPEVLPRIFDLFEGQSGDGTGIGLTLVKQIIEAHEGHIEARSNLGSGTEFRISLKAPGATASPRGVSVIPFAAPVGKNG